MDEVTSALETNDAQVLECHIWPFNHMRFRNLKFVLPKIDRSAFTKERVKSELIILSQSLESLSYLTISGRRWCNYAYAHLSCFS